MISTIILPNIKTFKLCLFNVSMTFFFFAFHVHEKTILIPLLGLGLSIKYLGYYYLDFVTFSCMSLYFLTICDKIDCQYFITTCFFWYFCNRMLKLLESMKFLKDLSLPKYNKISSGTFIKLNEENLLNNMLKLMRSIDNTYFKFLRFLFYGLMAFLHIIDMCVSPPSHLEGLWFWLIEIVAFFVFFIVWARSNIYLFYLVAKSSLKEKRIEKKMD